MRNRLSRTRARLSIVLFAVGVACLLIGYFVEGWLPTILGVVLAAVGMVVRPWKCRSAGSGSALYPSGANPENITASTAAAGLPTMTSRRAEIAELGKRGRGIWKLNG